MSIRPAPGRAGRGPRRKPALFVVAAIGPRPGRFVDSGRRCAILHRREPAFHRRSGRDVRGNRAIAELLPNSRRGGHDVIRMLIERMTVWAGPGSWVAGVAVTTVWLVGMTNAFNLIAASTGSPPHHRDCRRGVRRHPDSRAVTHRKRCCLPPWAARPRLPDLQLRAASIFLGDSAAW